MFITIYGRQNGRNGAVLAEVRIDSEDADLIQPYRWYLGGRKRRYVMATLPQGGTVLLHRLILNARPGDRIGHINGDLLDNRRANLTFLY